MTSHVMSHHITHVTLHHITSHHMSRHVTSHHMSRHHITSHHIAHTSHYTRNMASHISYDIHVTTHISFYRVIFLSNHNTSWEHSTSRNKSHRVRAWHKSNAERYTTSYITTYITVTLRHVHYIMAFHHMASHYFVRHDVKYITVAYFIGVTYTLYNTQLWRTVVEDRCRGPFCKSLQVKLVSSIKIIIIIIIIRHI